MGAVGAIAFVVLLLFAIFFHELGHYATARWAGVKIRQFFVGFGPTIWSYRRGPEETVALPSGSVLTDEEADAIRRSGDTDVKVVTRPETEYGIKLLPLGGYVRILGFSAFEEIAERDRPRSFKSVAAWKQAIVLVAGSATHFVTAFVLLFLVFSVFGLNEPTTVVRDVMPEIGSAPSPALAAGLRPGDRIVEIDGRAIATWDDIRGTVRQNPGRSLSMRIESEDGTRRLVQVVPAEETVGEERIGVVGVVPRLEVVRDNPIAGFGRSVLGVVGMTVDTVRIAPQAFTPKNLGLVPSDGPTEERAISIYGAGRVAADIASEGEIALFLGFVAQINVFIALFNLVPLPPLDGGHLLVVLIERVRRRHVSPRALMPVMAVVFTVLLVLGVSLLVQDIVSPVNPLE